MDLESSFSIRINFPKQAFLKEVYKFFIEGGFYECMLDRL